MSSQNILGVYHGATDNQRLRGALWYSQAWDACCGIAEDCGIEPETAAAIAAAISPGIRWERNVLEALAIARGLDVPMCSYPKNQAKARQLLLGADPTEVLNGPKTNAFWHNLCGDYTPVCVDRHAWAAANGYSNPKLAEKELKVLYRDYEQMYQEAADWADVAPAVMQATVWVVWREKKQ